MLLFAVFNMKRLLRSPRVFLFKTKLKKKKKKNVQTKLVLKMSIEVLFVTDNINFENL